MASGAIVVVGGSAWLWAVVSDVGGGSFFPKYFSILRVDL